MEQRITRTTPSCAIRCGTLTPVVDGYGTEIPYVRRFRTAKKVSKANKWLEYYDSDHVVLVVNDEDHYFTLMYYCPDLQSAFNIALEHQGVVYCFKTGRMVHYTDCIKGIEFPETGGTVLDRWRNNLS